MNSICNDLKRAAVGLTPLDRIDILLIDNLSRHIPTSEKDSFQIVLACMLINIHQGGLCISLDPNNLESRIRNFLTFFPDLGADLEIAKKLTLEFLEQKRAGLLFKVVGNHAQFLPVIEFNSRLYFQKFYAAEKTVGDRICELLKPTLTFPVDIQIDQICMSVLTLYPLTTGKLNNHKPIQFTNLQIQALTTSLRNKLTIINGGPGTGKTSIATNLLRAWTQAWVKGLIRPFSNDAQTRSQYPRIKLASPTGRASQRLSESIKANLSSVDYAGHENEPNQLSQFEMDNFISQIPSQTLHSLLGYNPSSGTFFFNADQNLPADLVIIDEVSMVDVFLLAQLLIATETNTCIILLGDMDQLPSVDAGSVLTNLIHNDDKHFINAEHPLKNNIVTLQSSHRFQSQISELAESINSMQPLVAFEKLRNKGFIRWPVPYLSDDHNFSEYTGGYWLTPKSILNNSTNPVAEFKQGLESWIDSWVDFHFVQHSYDQAQFPTAKLFDPKNKAYSEIVLELLNHKSTKTPEFLNLVHELFKYQNQARILTFTRVGWYGCVSINQKISLKLGSLWDPYFNRKFSDCFHGAPILILVNQPDKKLFNGDVGIILRLNGQLIACFQRGTEIEIFAESFLPRYELAFAITVHKSQGSEYDQVFLILPEAGNRLLFKETLYTALTRARNFVGIYGPEIVFKEAVSKQIIRESGLLDYLKTKLFN